MGLKTIEISISNYEKVIHATNESTNLNCIIAIHNTKLGRALGGVRSWAYNNFKEHLNDALRLSRAMSLKNSVCGINFGGGKAVINLKGIKKTPELYESYGELVDQLKNTYITAGDVGTSVEDLISISRATKYVSGIKLETSGPTAIGIFNAINTTFKFLTNKELEGSTIAISGIGKVGSKLSKLLFERNVNLIVSNIGKDTIEQLKQDRVSFKESNINLIFEQKCDIFSPCALGGIINSETIKKLKCKAIVGAANNQLDKSETATWLKKNNIFYAPDYLVNSGGVIAISCEINNSEDTLNDQLNKIGDKVLSLLKDSQKSDLSTDKITEDLAWKRINSKLNL
jgi:glutamate dehydrogenase/leucine dehydrogenase